MNYQEKLIENSLCFTFRSVQNLKQSAIQNFEKNKELKYAILHLWSGIFLILKARLYKEHWSLLVSSVDKTSLEDFKKGDFHGINFSQCKERLSKVLSIKLEGNENFLEDLRKRRNKFEHFFEHTREIHSESIKSILYKGLNFIIEFINKYLEDQDIGINNIESIQTIKDECFGLQEFCEKRMKVIKPNLDKASVVLTCNECYRKTLIHSKQDYCLECLFCHNKISLDEDNLDIPECDNFRGIRDYRPKEILNAPNVVCSSCERENGIIELPEEYMCLYCEEKFINHHLCGCGYCGINYLYPDPTSEDDYGSTCPMCHRYNP